MHSCKKRIYAGTFSRGTGGLNLDSTLTFSTDVDTVCIQLMSQWFNLKVVDTLAKLGQNYAIAIGGVFSN